MIVDIRVAREFDSSYFTNAPEFILEEYDIEKLLGAKDVARQKLKKYFN